MSDNPLVVNELTKRFGGLVAVDSLSFEVRKGEILGFIGPNGAGKTTVFNCIMGNYDVTSGTVHFEDQEITDWDTHKIVNNGLARVSQESNPIASMTAKENIRIFTFPNNALAFRGGADDSEIHEIASQVNLEEKLEMHPNSMAHADRRRLEIAKAIATEPTTLVLDEPFAGMNQAEVRTLSAQITELRDAGMSIVVVDHNMHGLMALVDRVIVLNDGKLLATGTPEEIANDQNVQQAYLAGETGGM